MNTLYGSIKHNTSLMASCGKNCTYRWDRWNRWSFFPPVTVTLSMLHFFLLVSIPPSLFPLFILFPFVLLLHTMAIIYSILSSPPTVLCHKLDVYTWCLALSPTLFPIATFITLICKQEHSAAKWRAGPLRAALLPRAVLQYFASGINICNKVSPYAGAE